MMTEKQKATEIEVLRRKLKHLHDKEIRLEADLALNLHPELEEGIIEVILGLTDCKRLEASLRVVDKPEDVILKQIETLQRTKGFYEEKIRVINDQLKELLAGTGDKFLETREEFANAKVALHETVMKHEDDFQESGIRVVDLLPDISRYFPE